MSPIRVLVAEDSLTVRKHIVEALERDDDILVAAEAGDGREAVDLCKRLRPDVVTMDMMMPGMNGLEATEQIMAHAPTPILIVSASLNRGEVFKTYDALAAGAVDVVEKPEGAAADEAWEAKLRAAVKLVSKIQVITHPRAKLGRFGRLAGAAASSPRTAVRSGPYELVVLGASTGGPAALRQVLSSLPPDFSLPCLLAIHVSAPFAQSLAEWLGAAAAFPVRLAEDGEPLPKPGTPVLLMAPPDVHLVVEGESLRLREGAPRHSCKPSIDVLFESVAAMPETRAIGCLLTGMGSDGAQGLLALRRAGALTIAQDEATCVVYGMPRAAAMIGAADRVLGLADIGPAVAAAAAQRGEGGRDP